MAVLRWGLALTLAFAVLTVAVVASWTDRVDAVGRPLARWALTHGLGPALRLVEVAFEPSVIMVCAVLVALAMLGARLPREALLVVTAVVATDVATGVVKIAVGRERPGWQWHSSFLSGSSFPSGHCSEVTAICGALVLTTLTLVREGRVRRSAARVVVTAAAVLVVLVAADRVLLGRHFPTDVVGGDLLGAAVVCCASAACFHLWPPARALASGPCPR